MQTKLGEHLVATPEAVQHGAVGPNGEQENIIAAAASEHGNITDDPEYRFFLHRHWSLLEAMQHSPYIAAKLSVWNSKGISKLNVRTVDTLRSIHIVNIYCCLFRNYWRAWVSLWRSANSTSSL